MMIFLFFTTLPIVSFAQFPSSTECPEHYLRAVSQSEKVDMFVHLLSQQKRERFARNEKEVRRRNIAFDFYLAQIFSDQISMEYIMTI